MTNPNVIVVHIYKKTIAKTPQNIFETRIYSDYPDDPSMQLRPLRPTDLAADPSRWLRGPPAETLDLFTTCLTIHKSTARP